jgi:hypothetical protein
MEQQSRTTSMVLFPNIEGEDFGKGTISLSGDEMTFTGQSGQSVVCGE